ncbi:Glycine receptor subunit alpha-3 [Lamellibrachia satsuma]|nr:Glycine receptor subunit alpha-3 [Lamellibrachia satsuma]
MDPTTQIGFRQCCVLLLVGLLLRGSIVAVSASGENAKSTSFVNSGEILRILLNHSDPGIRPNIDGPPVVVRCSFSIISFGPFSEVNMDYRLNIYLRQKWVDPRLTFRRFGDTDHVLVSVKDIERIWKPDLFFPNENSAAFHHVTVPNKLLRIYHNGTVLYSSRGILAVEDSYETKDLLLEWDGVNGVDHDKDMDLPQFQLVSEKTITTSAVYKIGNFSRLTATFELERLFGFFVLSIYVPTILIVILAWVSFWVNMDAVPARISLGVTTVLTMATQLSGSKVSIPKVHYPKAIDIWMVMCMMFVFVSMVEYTFVNALSRDSPKTETEEAKEKESEKDLKITGLPEEKFVDLYVIEQQLKSTTTCGFSSGREAALFLERVSRICFPIAFIIFNIVYWSVYLRPHETYLL